MNSSAHSTDISLLIWELGKGERENKMEKTTLQKCVLSRNLIYPEVPSSQEYPTFFLLPMASTSDDLMKKSIKNLLFSKLV